MDTKAVTIPILLLGFLSLSACNFLGLQGGAEMDVPVATPTTAPLIWNDLSSSHKYLMGSCLLLVVQNLRWPSRKDGQNDRRTGHYRRLINLIFAGFVPGKPEHRMTFIRRELPLSTIAYSGLGPNA